MEKRKMNNKKGIMLKILSLATSFISVFSVYGCGGESAHVHSYGNEIAAVAGDCYNYGVAAHYDCSCGKHFIKKNGEYVEITDEELKTPTVHDLGERIDRIAPTCEKNGTAAHYDCKKCGKSFIKRGSNYVEQSKEELVLPTTGHEYVCEVASDEYLVSDATEEARAIYKLSCKCGLASEALTFEYGENLAYYRNQPEEDYKPTSVTLTLYDAENDIYGFTYNTSKAAGKARIIYSEGEKLDKNAKTVTPTARKFDSFIMDGKEENISYYVYKAEIKLEPDKTYVYKITDEYAGTETEAAVINTRDTKASKFRFAHVSDSQVVGTANGSAGNAVGTGKDFGKVLSAIIENDDDFIIHTGDVVEYSKYENYWTHMLGDNFEYLSRIPVQAISGNHETTYRNGENETFKHFNYKMPEQSTAKGIYYSFRYGNAKFIMINTNRLGANRLTTDQYEWLERELKEEATWKIVSLHHPLYSVGKWGANPDKNEISLALRAQLAGLFAASGVDLVLQGHDHCVSRTFPINAEGKVYTENKETENGTEYSVNPEGVIYVMNGPAGNQSGNYVYRNDASLYAYAEISHSRSYAEIEIDGGILTVTVKYCSESGTETQKRWGIKKTA